MIQNLRIRLFLLVFTALAGCRDSHGVVAITGGTTGKIHNGREPLVGVQLTVHQLDGDAVEPVGVAASRLDGSFELVQLDGTAACELLPGEYRCTLETVGTPITIPQEFTNPKTTPLKIVLSEENEILDLNVPQLKNEK